jgi:O-antigen/teichoic acid export membrane protein
VSQRILRQVLHTTGTKVFVFLSRFALVYLLAHVFAPEDFGAYSLMSTFNTFGVMLVGLNLYNYVYREVPGLPLGQRVVLFKTTFVFEVLLSSALVGLFLASGTLPLVLARLRVSNYADASVVSLLLLIALVGAAEVQHYLWARTDIEHANRMEVITQALWVPVLIAFWFLKGKISVAEVLLAQLLAVLAGILFAFGRVERIEWLRARPSLALIRPALAFSVPMIIPGLSFYVLKLADRFFLSYFRSLAEVGLYSFVCSFLNTLYSFSALVVLTTVLPYAMEAHNQKAWHRRNHVLTYALKNSLLVFGIGAAGLLIFSRRILAIVGRQEYTACSDVMPMLVFCFLLIITAYPAHYLLMLEKRTALIMRIELCGLAIGLGFDLLLIPRYSYYGAAVASVLGFGAVAIAKIAWSRAWRQIQFQEIFSWRREWEFISRALRPRKEFSQSTAAPE